MVILCVMDKITYARFTGIRFSEDAQRAIMRIIQFHSKPGLDVNRTQAVHIALAEYAKTLPPLVEVTEEHEKVA